MVFFWVQGQQANKVIARGLHPPCKAVEIIDDLWSKGYNIIDATNIIKKEKSENEQGECRII